MRKGEIPFFIYGTIRDMYDADKKVMRKLYVIIALCALISIALFILLLGGGVSDIQETLSRTAAPVKETPEVTKTPVTTPVPAVTPEPEEIPDTTSDDSLLRIVNQDNPLDRSYVPDDLVAVSVSSEGTQYLRKEAADSLNRMFADAETAGVQLIVISGYRSYDFEVENEQTFINAYGEDYAAMVDCHPGISEHQLGLMADFGTRNGTCRLDTCFASTKESTWLKENAWKYGWIERHPQGKEAVTGVMYSPWNYRYVGTDAAKEIHASGMTMEEFFSRRG